jgi:methyl-accepting chemotaxis protein
MKLWDNMTIRKKIMFSFTVILIVFAICLSFSAISSIKKIGMNALNNKGSSLAIMTAETVKPAVQYNVREDAEKVLEQLIASDEDLNTAAVVIQGPKGDLAVTCQKTAKNRAAPDLVQPLKALASRPPAKKGEMVMLDRSNPVYLAVKIDLTSNDTIQNGYLLLALNDSSLSKELNNSKAIIGGLGLLMLAVSMLCAFFISSSITNPIKNAVVVANNIANGDLRTSVSVTSQDEVGQMMLAMQNMVSHLREMISGTVLISNGIASAASQLHTVAEQIATGVEESAAQTNTVATASQEMSATSSDIARNCTIVADASRRTSESAHAGGRLVKDTINGITVIAERVRQTSDTIVALGVRSDQIGQIVGTIEDIADQTNLLALNAAIEAARAGEQGRGFAVVADEVRSLAVRTTNATREISEMIKTIQKETREAVIKIEDNVTEVEKGAAASQSSGQALEEIVSQINEVTQQINQIATAAEQQTSTTGEVTNNIQQITDVVHQTARGAEGTASAAAKLSSEAHELQRLVSRFQL